MSLALPRHRHNYFQCIFMIQNGKWFSIAECICVVCAEVLRHSQQLRSCRAGQLPINTVPGQASTYQAVNQYLASTPPVVTDNYRCVITADTTIFQYVPVLPYAKVVGRPPRHWKLPSTIARHENVYSTSSVKIIISLNKIIVILCRKTVFNCQFHPFIHVSSFYLSFCVLKMKSHTS